MTKDSLKIFFKSKSKKYWVLTSIIICFAIGACVAGVIGMYACGYTIITWFKKFGWIFVIALSIVAILVCGILLIKARKD